MAGQDVCRMHGGASGQAKAKAAKRLQEADVMKLLDAMDIHPVTNPVPVLQELAGEVVAFLRVAREQVAKLDRVDTTSGDGVEHVKAAIGVYEKGLDRAHRVLSDMVKNDLAERAVAIDERLAAQMVDLMRAVREDPTLALTATQKAGFFPAVQRARAALN